MKQRDSFTWTGIIFMFIGIIFILVGVFGLCADNQMKANLIQVEATVEAWDGGGTYVRYTYDGEEYVARLNVSDSSYRIGTPVTIYCDRRNPENVSAPATFVWVIFTCMGALLLVIGGAILVAKHKRRRSALYLKAHGKLIYANISGVRVNSRVSSNYQHPYMVICEGLNLHGKVVEYHSDHIWYNPEPYLKDVMVPVYIDPRNPKRYYVDLTEILPSEE